MLCKERGTPLIRALLLTFSHVGIYFAHSTVLLTAVEICKETRVFPKLNLLANHRLPVLDKKIIMPHVEKLGAKSTCRERQ